MIRIARIGMDISQMLSKADLRIRSGGRVGVYAQVYVDDDGRGPNTLASQGPLGNECIFPNFQRKTKQGNLSICEAGPQIKLKYVVS